MNRLVLFQWIGLGLDTAADASATFVALCGGGDSLDNNDTQSLIVLVSIVDIASYASDMFLLLLCGVPIVGLAY